MSFILQLAGGALQSSLSLRPSIRSFSVKVDVPDKRRHKCAAKTLAKAFAKSYGEKVGREVDPANLSLECNGTKLPSDATCGELLDSRRIMICVRERKAPAARAAAPGGLGLFTPDEVAALVAQLPPLCARLAAGTYTC